MMNDVFVDTYVTVCRDLGLDDNESRRLWQAIVKEIQRVASEFSDPESASEEEIRAACERLRVPSFRQIGENIRNTRATEQHILQMPVPIAPLPGGFSGITRQDRVRVAQLAHQFLEV